MRYRHGAYFWSSGNQLKNLNADRLFNTGTIYQSVQENIKVQADDC